MRSDLENNKARDLDIRSTRLGVQRTLLTGNITLPADAPLTNYFDPNGADREITLPEKERGLYLIIFNVGPANTLTIKDDLGVTMIVLTTIEGASFFCSGREWRYLSGISSVGLAAELESLDNSITITPTSPTKTDIEVNEAFVDHNALLNYVADQHVAHSGVTITAGVGLAGGGNIAANRTIDLDLSDLVSDTPVLGDTFAFFDVSGGDTNKATLTTLNSILDHDALLGFVANEHIDHTTVSITAGTGLTGGGTIAANRTISLDINGLTSDSPVGTDLLAFYDVGGADHNKVTIAAVFAMMLPGADKQIIFNDAGVFGADPGFAYNKATDTLEFSTGSRIGFDNLDVVIIHGANTLSFNGATSGYVFTNGPIRGVVDTDTASTQVARLEGDRATPTANDEGYLSFYLSDSGGTQTEFARISWVATTITDLSEAGALDFGVVSGGAFADRVRLTAAAIQPSTNDGLSLGISGTAWSDAFFASGAVINFNAGDVTITHAANALAFAGASVGYTFDALVSPLANDGAALGTATVSFSDLFLASGAVIGFANGDVTITHSANLLTFAGATGGYSFDDDLLLPSAGVINWNAGDVTITHSANTLAFAGASSGYTYDSLNTITSTSASALTVGRQGATNPVLKINAATASVVTGIEIIGAAAAGRVVLAAISSGADEGLSIDAKGTGTIRLGATSTGAIEFSRNAVPTASDGAALGTTALMWADLFLASGGVVNWNNGTASLTESAAQINVLGAWAFTSDITPPEITADQNNYNPTGLSSAVVLRLDTDISRSITGLAGGADGRIIIIHNIGTTDIVFVDESASSTAGNRFALSANLTLAGDQSVFFQYDSTSSRWRMIGGSGGGGGGAPTGAQYLTLATDASLSAERVFTPGSGLAGTDGGAGGNYTLALDINGLTEDTTPDVEADYVATWDGSASAHKKVKIQNLSGRVLLTSGTISNSAGTVDFVLTAYTEYRAIEFYFFSTVPGTDGSALLMRTSTNGGSTYDAGASDYGWTRASISDDGAGGFVYITGADDLDSEMTITDSGTGAGVSGTGPSSTVTDGGVAARITLYNQTSTAGRTLADWDATFQSTGGTPDGVVSRCSGGGNRRATADVDAVRFLWSSGNWAASSPGTYAIYGVR